MNDIWTDDTGVWVRLSLADMLHGANVGVIRQSKSEEDNRKAAKGVEESNASQLGIHIEGACGELAVAKVRGVYFSGGVDTFSAPDVGKNVQVRTRRKHSYELIVRKTDNPNHYYVLVTGQAPLYCVRGWIQGKDAMNERFLANHGDHWNAAYFVPANELKPMKVKD